MAESTQLENLNLSETASFCIPRRRRPIRSNTYFKFVQLLSLCPGDDPQFNDGDNDDAGLRSGSAEDIPVRCDELKSEELLTPKDDLVIGTSIDNNKDNVASGGGVNADGVVVTDLVGANLAPGGQLPMAQASSISVGNFLVDQNPASECSIHLVDELENLDYLDGILGLHSIDPGPTEQMKVDSEFSIDDFCEVLDSCYGRDTDTVLEPSKLGEYLEKNDVSLVVNKPEEFHNHVQLKDTELEKLNSTSGAASESEKLQDAADAACPINADEEIEDGEICGEPGVSDDTTFTLPENISIGMKNEGVIHTSVENFEKKESFCDNEQRGFSRQETCGHSLVSTPNNDNNYNMKFKLRESSIQMQNIQPLSGYRNGHVENRAHDPTSDTFPLSGRSLQENATKEPASAVTEKDCDGSKKKRKKGPLTKEKRAKKKLKSRIKRAEMNRKLGVKRLKIQPVLKPKTITYCRHYLQGRCHEGEKCKFSHDTTPLTKSKPCGHFARHSCMKGDDCPFDHELSKYPCNNYISTGFCGRGAECLFSHKMPANQIMSTTPDILNSALKPEQIMPDKEAASSKLAKAETMFPTQLNNSKISNPGDILPSHQKLDVKVSNIQNSSGKSITRNVGKPFARTVGQAPKGVTFLSDPNRLLGRNSKLEQDGVFQKGDDGVKIGCETTHDVTGTIIKVNEEVTLKKPRGINFLSFSRPSLENPSSEMFSHLFSKSFEELGKSGMTNLAVEKQQTCSFPKSDNSCLISCQQGQTATSLAPNLDQDSKEASTPQRSTHNSSLSPHRMKTDDTAFKGDIVLSRVGEKPTEPGKVPLKTPQLFSGGASDQTSVQPYRNATSSFKSPLLANTPNMVQRAIQSALALAAEFEPEIKLSRSFTNGTA